MLAERLKPTLPSVIHQDQKGFVKGRYIGECIKTTFEPKRNFDQKNVDQSFLSNFFFLPKNILIKEMLIKKIINQKLMLIKKNVDKRKC